MDGAADLFEWAKQSKRAKRRGPRPSGFHSALALVVKYGKLAEQGTPPKGRRFEEGQLRRPALAERRLDCADPGPLFAAIAPVAPATRKCPRCSHVGPVDTDFGSRRLKGELRPQSWCRECRATAKRAHRAVPVEADAFALIGA